MANGCGNAGTFLSPTKFWSFSIGAVPSNAYSYTDVVDLGEDNFYTFLIAKKIGVYSSGEYLEIQSSVDGARWAPAAGIYVYSSGSVWFVARSRPNSSSIYCVWGRPIGRYVRVMHKNGSSAQSNLIIGLGALGGI